MRRAARHGLAVALGLAGVAAAQEAPIATDGLVGTAGPQALRFDADGAMTIGAALGQQVGANLFHSFSRFGVPAGAQAVIESPGPAGRVIARVTGATPTRIDGSLALNPASDLVLLSPGGLIVGPSGSIDGARALHLSTAGSLRFADGATFTGEAGVVPTLSIAPPTAFGFLDGPSGSLRLDGATLEADGPTTLAGAVVEFAGAALTSAFGDPVSLLTGGPGDAAPLAGAAGLSAFPPGAGEVRLIGAGPGGTNGAPGARAGVALTGGGVLAIRAGRLIVDGAEALVERSVETLHPEGVLDVAARDVRILRDGALRTRTARTASRAPDIRIAGFETMTVSRDGATNPMGETAVESEALPGAVGSAGAVLIDGDVLRLADEGRVFSNTSGLGDAGTVRVTVDRLFLEGGGQIASAALDVLGAARGRGAGGDVVIRAREAVSIAGRGRRPNPLTGAPEPSGVFASTEGVETGPAGSVRLSAPLVTVSDGGEIAAETLNAAPAGALRIDADALLLTDGAEITTLSRGAGDAGAIEIEAGSIVVASGAQITSRAERSPAAAGAVNLSAGSLTLETGARVSTTSQDQDGGDVALTVGGVAALSAASLTTSVAAGGGGGGDIAIDAGALVLRDGAVLRANAIAGDGGDIRLAAGAVVTEPGSVIEAVSVSGDDGAITVIGAATAATADLRPPPTDFFDSFALIDDSCVAAVTGGSALTLAGPPAPARDETAAPGLFSGAIAYPAVASVDLDGLRAPDVALSPAPCAPEGGR